MSPMSTIWAFDLGKGSIGEASGPLQISKAAGWKCEGRPVARTAFKNKALLLPVYPHGGKRRGLRFKLCLDSAA